MGQSAKPRRSREEHPTPEQVALIAEYVRQRKALGIWPPQELAYFTTLAKEIGFWRLRKDIEQTAEMYAKSIAPPVRYIGYPPSASDPPPLYKSWYDFLETVTDDEVFQFERSS